MPVCKKGREPTLGKKEPRFRCKRCGLRARKKAALCKAKAI